MEPPRSQQQRKQDTLGRLESDADAWIATADPAGNGYLLPLSFLWDGAGVIVSTPRSSPTGRNLSRGGRVRVGLGELRDVTMIDGTAEPIRFLEFPPFRPVPVTGDPQAALIGQAGERPVQHVGGAPSGDVPVQPGAGPGLPRRVEQFHFGIRPPPGSPPQMHPYRALLG